MSPRRRTSRSVRKSTTKPRDRAWTAMRISKNGVFTVADILAAAEINEISFARMLGAYRRTGFVKKLKNHNPREKSACVFLLLRNSGPFRPWAQSDGVVYDRNTGIEYKPSKKLDGWVSDGT